MSGYLSITQTISGGFRLTLEVRLWDTAVTEPPDVFWPMVAPLISTKWDCVFLQGAVNILTALPPHADTIQSCSLNHPKTPKNTQSPELHCSKVYVLCFCPSPRSPPVVVSLQQFCHRGLIQSPRSS